MRAVITSDRHVFLVKPAPLLPLGTLDGRRVGSIPLGEELIAFGHAAEKFSHPTIVRIEASCGTVRPGHRFRRPTDIPTA